MKRYEPLFERQTITTTLEFFIKGNKLFVNYNNNTIPFLMFCDKHKYPESELILKYLYQEIIYEYNYLPDVKLAKENNEKREVVILDFIMKYFPKKENPIDVMIKNNGEVTFNIEDN